VGLAICGGIVERRRVYGIFGREGIVRTAGKEVFLGDGLGVEGPGAGVAAYAGVGLGIKCEVGRSVRIDGELLESDAIRRFNSTSGAGEATLVGGSCGLRALEQAEIGIRRGHSIDGGRGAA